MRWSWKLQEWSPFIQYIKGRDNVVADYLSRNPGSDDTSVEREPQYMYPPLNATRVSRTNSRSNLRLTCNVDREKLRTTQIEAGPSFYEKYASEEFVKFNDVLCKISGNKLLPVITDSLIPNVISYFHDSVTSGHGGIERTLVKFSRSAYFE
jgi:hypothetical protein